MALRWLVGWIIAIALLGLGVWLLLGAVRQRIEAEASANWPSVTGVVETATVESFTHRERWADPITMYRPRVTYAYVVDGRRYEGTRIGVETASSRYRTVAAGALDPYQPGTAVWVYYDPDRPDRALLERGLSWKRSLVPLAGGLLMVGGSALIVWLGWLSPYRPRLGLLPRHGNAEA